MYWEYDAPQSRKWREAFAKEFDDSDSQVAKKNEAPPKLKMVAKSRIESNEQARKGEEAMQELLDLYREAEVKDVRKRSGKWGESLAA